MTREPTDFSAILEQLKEWGINDYQMAELTGLDRSKLTKLRSGARKQPNYDDGCSIVKIYNSEKMKLNRSK